MTFELLTTRGSFQAWTPEAGLAAHPAPLVLSCRDVWHGGGHLAGALAAAVAGERYPVFPRLHEQRRPAGPGHRAHAAGALGDRGGADAHSPHLCDGE